MDYNFNNNNSNNNNFNNVPVQNTQNSQYNQYNQYSQYNQYMTPEMQMQFQKQKEDDKKANMLCIASILCTIFGYIAIPMFTDLNSLYWRNSIAPSFIENIFGTLADRISTVLAGLGGVSHLAGFILMIIARVKYPRNTFAKVLMWIYIIGIILSVLLVVVLVASCFVLLKQCADLG